MQSLLDLLAEQNRIITAEAAVIAENYRAMNSMADDIIADTKRRGHIEFSIFTGDGGRS